MRPDDETPAPPLSERVRRAIPEARALLRVHRAMVAYDPTSREAVGACRAATYRYLEALAPDLVGPGEALRRLRVAMAAWAPPRLTTAERLELDGRLRFWVGTVHGLRWRQADEAARSPDAGS